MFLALLRSLAYILNCNEKIQWNNGKTASPNELLREIDAGLVWLDRFNDCRIKNSLRKDKLTFDTWGRVSSNGLPKRKPRSNETYPRIWNADGAPAPDRKTKTRFSLLGALAWLGIHLVSARECSAEHRKTQSLQRRGTASWLAHYKWREEWTFWSATQTPSQHRQARLKTILGGQERTTW